MPHCVHIGTSKPLSPSLATRVHFLNMTQNEIAIRAHTFSTSQTAELFFPKIRCQFALLGLSSLFACSLPLFSLAHYAVLLRFCKVTACDLQLTVTDGISSATKCSIELHLLCLPFAALFSVHTATAASWASCSLHSFDSN